MFGAHNLLQIFAAGTIQSQAFEYEDILIYVLPGTIHYITN